MKVNKIFLIGAMFMGMSVQSPAAEKPLRVVTTLPDYAVITKAIGGDSVNVQAIVKAHDCFFARSTTYHLAHLEKCIAGAMEHEGFSFVDARTHCIVNNGRRLGFKDSHEMLMHFKKTFKTNDGAAALADNEIGMTR